jgi:chemotaxis protein MotB
MQTRIIVKKKAGHGGHHGGAWKVAYADFVTAMMALFIVLWLMNASKQVQEAIGGYFKDPTGQSKMIGSNLAGSGENFLLRKEDMRKLKEQLEKAIQQVPDLEKLKKQIEITITAEGLRIELLETEKGTFFDLGNSTPSPSGKELLSLLAREIGKLQNRVSIEGHTDSKPYQGEAYSNWELSADRANAARRIMMLGGLSPTQVKQVRGYADQQLRNKDNPEDPANRRISVIVHYVQNGPENQGKELQEEFKSQAPVTSAK